MCDEYLISAFKVTEIVYITSPNFDNLLNERGLQSVNTDTMLRTAFFLKFKLETYNCR